jgi:uncharacterized membrane protein YgaE (UPF0421/DUF939 family)
MSSKRYKDQSDWDKLISPITLKNIKKGTWEIFKSLVPRKENLNDKIISLIEKFIQENSEELTSKEINKWYKDQEYYEKKRKKKK